MSHDSVDQLARDLQETLLRSPMTPGESFSAIQDALRAAYREGQEAALDEVGVLHGEDARRLLDDLKNVCSEEEAQKRREQARAFLEMMTRRKG